MAIFRALMPSRRTEAFHIALEVFTSRIDIASVLPELSLHLLGGPEEK